MAHDDGLSPEGAEYLERGPGSGGESRTARAEAIDVTVEQGTVRVYHVRGSGSGRPVVFIAGWGAIWESFRAFYDGLSPETEVFHVETREKSSSCIDRRTAEFTMDHFARDIRRVIEHFNLEARDPVLAGTCFGSAVLVHGLATGILDAPSIVCFDPMERLWVPKWVIDLLGPITPTFVLRGLRSLISAAVLAGMREPVQRERSARFIRSATVWKWRRAAITVKKWSLLSLSCLVRRRVHVVNGSHDRFHNSGLFPRIAQSLSDGVFVRIQVGESNRERMMGVTASVFSESHPAEATPSALRPFVVALDTPPVDSGLLSRSSR